MSRQFLDDYDEFEEDELDQRPDDLFSALPHDGWSAITPRTQPAGMRAWEPREHG